MELQQFKDSLYVNLEFRKANVFSKVLKIEEDGIRYSIGKNGNSKKVTFEEIQLAISEVERNGCITRQWFNETSPIQAKTAGCNFTTIGGLLQHFLYVDYSPGKYTKAY